MKALMIALGLLAVGALSSGALAAPPGCTGGDGLVSFAPYSGPGGTFTFKITFENGDECVVEFQVPDGTTSAETLASLFAGMIDAMCGDIASGIDYPDLPEHAISTCIRREETLGDDVGVSRIQGTNPQGVVSGFSCSIPASPAVARFDFGGSCSTGHAQITVGGQPMLTPTDGKTPMMVKSDLLNELLLAGYVANMELAGDIRVLFMDSTVGVAVHCSDPAMWSSAMIGLDFDGDGLEDVYDCPADITGMQPGQPDGDIDSLDYLMLIAQWSTPCAGTCEADFTGPVPQVPDGNVDSLDFLMLIAQWGKPSNCPHP
jgi:hypothetical protein